MILAAGVTNALDVAGQIADAGAVVIIVLVFVAVLRGWLILPRELNQCRDRLVEVAKEKDEWKSMALRALSSADRVVTAVEERGSS